MGEIADAVHTFVKVFAEGARQRGFSRRGRYLERHRDDVIDTVYLQGAQRNKDAREFPDADVAYLFVNLFAYLPKLDELLGREPLQHPNTRGYPTRLEGSERETWQFTLDNAPAAAERCLAMFDAVGEQWFRSWSYEKVLADAEATGHTLPAVLAAAEALGQPERFWAIYEQSLATDGQRPYDYELDEWMRGSGRRPSAAELAEHNMKMIRNPRYSEQ
jgi:hypothetical protein